MNIRPQQYDAEFLAAVAATGQAVNETVAYGVRIVGADVTEGQTYWRAIGIHHLTPTENGGGHHVYLEALDETGQRFRGAPPWVRWTWEGRRPNDVARPVLLDKPSAEPGGNIPMGRDQIVTVWVGGLNANANEPSDRVENLHTRHPDEPGPHGELWNSIGHHSFYVVFQRTRRSELVPGDGVIRGSIANGRRYRVRLLRDNTLVAEQTADDAGVFAFNQLRPGAYRLEATGPTVGCDQILLDDEHKQIILDLNAG